MALPPRIWGGARPGWKKWVSFPSFTTFLSRTAGAKFRAYLYLCMKSIFWGV